MNAPKNKGTAAETAVVRWLRNNGFPYARRIALAGSNDQGDVWVAPNLILEVKNVASAATGQPSRKQLERWLNELDQETQAHALGLVLDGALVVKRKGTTDVGQWWCYSFASDLIRDPFHMRQPDQWVCSTLDAYLALLAPRLLGLAA